MRFATKCAMLAIAVAVIMASNGAYAKSVKKNLYMFGCSASFTDSIVYITDVQVIEGADYDTKNKKLISRDMYSSQLKQYLTEKMEKPHRTCFVVFSDNEKKIAKRMSKLKALYTTKSQGKFDVRFLGKDAFSFTVVSDDEETATEE